MFPFICILIIIMHIDFLQQNLIFMTMPQILLASRVTLSLEFFYQNGEFFLILPNSGKIRPNYKKREKILSKLSTINFFF